MENSNLSKSLLFPCNLPFSPIPPQLSSPSSSPSPSIPPSSQQPTLPLLPMPLPLSSPPPPSTPNNEWTVEEIKMLEDILEIDHHNFHKSPDLVKNIAMKVPEKPVEGIKNHYKVLVPDGETIKTGKRPMHIHNTPTKTIRHKIDDKTKNIKESTSSSGKISDPKQKLKRIAWSENEHRLFLKGHEIYGRRWKTISKFMKTKTPTQVASHGQNYLRRQAEAASSSFKAPPPPDHEMSCDKSQTSKNPLPDSCLSSQLLQPRLGSDNNNACGGSGNHQTKDNNAQLMMTSVSTTKQPIFDEEEDFLNLDNFPNIFD
ncbi:hypothetical protein ACOSP7_022489 [Xanthoceras sorbifolium]